MAAAIRAGHCRSEGAPCFGQSVPTREGYKGAARLKTKTVEEMQEDREAANRNAGEADKAKERPQRRIKVIPHGYL